MKLIDKTIKYLNLIKNYLYSHCQKEKEIFVNDVYKYDCHRLKGRIDCKYKNVAAGPLPNIN